MGPAHASRGWTDLQDEPNPLRHKGEGWRFALSSGSREGENLGSSTP